MYFLDNKLAPLTFSWGFIEAPLNTVVEDYTAWINSSENIKRITKTTVQGRLSDLLWSLSPIAWPDDKVMFMETNSSYTAYFDNNEPGAEFSTVISLCRHLRCQGLMVTSVPDLPQEKNKDGATVVFSVITPDDSVRFNIKREIRVVHDGRWEFDSMGDPLPFEELEQYQAKRVKDRLTTEMLARYCQHLGISAFEEEFYGPNGVLVTLDQMQYPHFRHTDIRAQQAKIGIDKL